MTSGPLIAVVGMDCLLPGASSAEEWIARSLRGECSLSTVPEGRWPLDPAACEARGLAADGATTLVGGFVDDDGSIFDWVQRVTSRALEGVVADRARTSLLLANLSLPSTAAVRVAGQAYLPWLEAMGADTSWLVQVEERERYQSGGPALDAATALGLGGTALSLDAACASSLYAVRLACQRLAMGLDDCVLAAGAQRADSAFLFMGFTQLRALSATGIPRPLDARADGLIIGEGAACVALKRLEDARRDGDTIHAILDGGGLGNDGRSGNMLAPSASGQLRTLRQAWEGRDLDSLGYVECHATGTALGDGVELEALRALLGEREVVLASAKALIGHTITVAGLAGLIRAVGAVRDRLLPGQPDIVPRDEASGFSILTEATPWTADERVAAVSAFGFGGTNAHVIVRSAGKGHSTVRRALPSLAVTAARMRRGEVDGETVSRGLSPLPGSFVDVVAVDPGRFRMPPRELADLLPQQLLALDLAARAAADDGHLDGERTGAVLGMGIDGNVADHVLRWVAGDQGDAVASPLTASRVQGLLPNFVANRLAAQLGLEGPSLSVSAEALSGLVAVEQAALLLATGAVDAVLAGAVDLPGHPGLGGVSAATRGALAEGGAVFVLRRAEDVPEAERVATLVLSVDEGTDRPRSGHAECAEGALALFDALEAGGVVALSDRGRSCAVRVTPGAVRPRTDLPEPARSLPLVTTAHGGASLPWPAWQGRWGSDAVPRPRPRRSPPSGWARVDGAVQDETAVPLTWAVHPPLAPESSRARPEPVPLPPRADPPTQVPAMPASPARPSALAREAAHLSELARALHRSTAVATAAHSEWLRAHTAAGERVAAAALSMVGGGGTTARPAPISFDMPGASLPSVPEPPTMAVVPAPATSVDEPSPLFDLDALRAFAEGSISSCLGPEYADLDGYEPRVRLPMDPLLLVSRVVEMEGERGELKASRLVTEYDLPSDAVWVDRGKPPVSVVIESGQADLFLVSVLGVDAHCKGERLYRLLDCDLTFHGPRPDVGETLRHDIRIKRFARLSGKILFYFEYDCTSRTDGRPVLTMRDGVAGFFTPEELAVPQGVDPTPPDTQASPVAPRIAGAPNALDAAALEALRDGRFSDALGSAFASCDGALLRPPSGPWGLLDRAPVVALSGGPHGLGRVLAEQDLRDDDWFNLCHFKGDPCMPGTLMFDGCTQALGLWLLAGGHAADYPDAHFEPVAGQTARLRCRGQVVPGQHKLVYDARITATGLEPTPWVIADVILHVDGTPVVRAEGVSLRLDGERVAVRPQVTESAAPTLPGETDFLEFAVGRPSRAFGEAFIPHDSGDLRCPRIPGPPLALIHEVIGLRAPRGELRGGTGVTMRTHIPTDAPYLTAQHGRSLPVVALMEIALQPCGWLTAWEGAALGKGDLYFRNLGGSARVASVAWGDVGALTVDATLTRVSESAGMILTFFDFSVHAEDGSLVCEGDTHFGYFSEAALAAQKGLGLDAATEARLAKAMAEAAIPPVTLDEIREDWRMVDRVIAADPSGGEAGLGFYAAEIEVDPDAWFFVAHFHQDPVMPGSLGVEGLAQLAAFALGAEEVAFLDQGTLDWKYRGQVTRDRRRLLLQLEVTERSGEHLVARGWLTADGTPIYAVEGLSVRAMRGPERALAVPVRPPPRAALIDTWQGGQDEGMGTLRLDPALHPWLADHCPTLVIPAVPMAFAVEIAAEAALMLRPGSVVLGAPHVSAERWIAPTEPTDLLIAAVAEGDLVMVSLALHHQNERFPALSGPKVHMRVAIQVGRTYPPSPRVPAPLDAPSVAMSVREYYDGGHTFHGPALQGLVDLGVRCEESAESTFRAAEDARLLGEGMPPFVLDPLLLDVATHPMFSSAPETWGAAGPGTLAYPIGAENMRFFGPRPTGEVRCRLDRVDAGRQLVFDVSLCEGDRVWANFRWREAVVDGGLLGAPADVIRRFCVDRESHETVVGSAIPQGWRVAPDDVVEPLEGSLVRLLGRPEEVSAYEAAEDRRTWLQGWLAVKEAVRASLREHLGREVHPASLRVVELSEGWVVVEATDITSQEHLDVVGPTHCCWRLETDGADVLAVRVER